MPITIVTNPDLTTIFGSVSITADPYAVSGANSSGNLSVQNITASSASLGGLNSSFSSGLIVSGGFVYDVMSGGIPAATTSSQSLSASGVAITMTSGMSSGGPHVLFVSAASTTATCVLTPTSSASTSGFFQNGTEVTLVNIGASGSNVLIPTSSGGTSQQAAITLSAGKSCRFRYYALLQSWLPESL